MPLQERHNVVGPRPLGQSPARRDDVVGGLASELVGVLGGYVGHICRPFVVVGMHPKRIVHLACVSERTTQVGLS